MDVVLLALTLLGFVGGVALQRRFGSPLLNPTLFAAAGVIALLVTLDVPYARYARATEGLTTLLAPAVVALAVPMYRQRALLARQWRALVVGGALGTVGAMGVAWGLGTVLGLERPVALALLTASATSPVALAVTERLGGAPALAAALAIVAGLAGATLLPGWLSRLGVASPVARGVATGAVSHGIGTVRAREESELTGAASSLGMGLGLLVVTLVSALLA